MAFDDPQRRSWAMHKRHVSTPARPTTNAITPDLHQGLSVVTPTDLPSPRRPTSRFINTVKRSLSVQGTRRPQSGKTNTSMYSTPDEQNIRPRPRHIDASSSPPTIEQIAMGLHLSCTPHLRQTNGPYPSPYGRNSAHGSQNHHEAPLHRGTPATPLPPPPARSSLKKPSTVTSSANPGLSTASSTTITSNTPSTPQSTRSFLSLRMRMSRFLPGTRAFSAPSSTVASDTSLPRGSTPDISPKKEVRFSTADRTLALE